MRIPIVAHLVALALSATLLYFPWHPDRFRFQAFLALGLVHLLWSHLILKKLKLPLAYPAFIYLFWTAANCFVMPPFSTYGKNAVFFQGPTAYAYGLFVLFVTALTYTTAIQRAFLFRLFEAGMVLSSIQLLLHKPGMLDNPALDASLIACTYGVSLLRDDYHSGYIEPPKTPLNGLWATLYHSAQFTLPPLAILLTHSSTGIFCLMAVLLALGVQYIKDKTSIIILAVLALGVFGVGLLFQGSVLFNSSGRVQAWKMFFTWLRENNYHIFGMGLGTFEQVAPQVQMLVQKLPLLDQNPNGSFFMYAHNDSFQILFEMGWVGLILCLVPLIKLTWDVRKKWIFPAIASIWVCSASQSPLRIAVLTLFVTLCFREIIED
jgi:O-antigen ligase